MTLLRVSNSIAPNFPNEDQATALSVFKRALQAPFRTMAENAGISAEIALMSVDKGNVDLWQGMNFSNGQRTNLKQDGVLDPAKVTRCALKNAVSVAGTLLLTNHSIVHQ